MSKTKIDPLLRVALYETYGKKCFYTGVPLDFTSFEVDHIIPESYSGRLEELRLALGIDSDFSINGIDNLVPAANSFNKKKGDVLVNSKPPVNHVIER